jgi:hypothetical protein
VTRQLGAVMVGLTLSACAARRPPARGDYGIPRCPPAAVDHLLLPDALQCWFDAPHGRWRTLSRESHYAVLVVQVEAMDLDDAEAIAQAFVRNQRATISEILIYAHREGEPSTIRRVRWTAADGFETLEFTVPE